MSAIRETIKADTAPNLAAIKTKQQATWASGDFAVIGTTLQIVGETSGRSRDVCAGERVLDIAAGNGNATLAAAHRFAHVTSTDYVPELLDKGAAQSRRRPRREVSGGRCRSATFCRWYASTWRSRRSA